MILFDSHDTGPGCHHEDKLAVIGEVWGKCVEWQPLYFKSKRHSEGASAGF